MSGLAGLAGLAALGGCATRKPAPPPPPRAPMPSAVPPPPVAQRPLPPPAAAPAPPPPITREARNWTEYRTLAARRLVQANPDMTYMGTPPEPLLAIPILEIELYVDGSIQNIRVQRQPRQAVDTVQLAINAVRRAAPFPPVGHLPRPWRFTEVFLFDDQRRFKPRTLDV
ncbi:MAG: hypothetical protein JNJ71_15855 [Rubrivivax sp.]|nr:hypothetical protein [Rubrivivax sp.]